MSPEKICAHIRILTAVAFLFVSTFAIVMTNYVSAVQPSGKDDQILVSPESSSVHAADASANEDEALVPPPLITDAVSREVSVFVVDAAVELTDAVSREVSVFVTEPPVEFTDAISREISVFVAPRACSADPNDCNHNDIPDACDIVDCTGNVACDDCNLNGVPDSCDIESGTSLDANPPFGVPDECIDASAGVNWSDDIWNLSAIDPYPDNLNPNAVPDLGVTLPAGVDLVLDVSVQVDSLRLLNESALRVNQPGNAGNFSVKSPGNLAVNGELRVANDRTVSVPTGATGTAAVSIGAGGIYHKDPDSVTATSATLSTSDVVVRDCATPCASGGVLELTDNMAATITGSLTIEGFSSNSGIICQSDSGFVAGGHTPPIVRVKNNAYLTLGGPLVLGASAHLIVNSSASVTIGGDFVNQSTRPDCFICPTGKFKMNGITPQLFEVAATDLGIFPFLNATQFAMGRLEVAAGSHVTFSDLFDNDAHGQGTCSEALYVDTLALGAGSTITLDNCRVYFHTLVQDPSAIVTTVDCGGLVQFCPSVYQGVPDLNCDQRLDLADLGLLLGGPQGQGGCLTGPCLTPPCSLANMSQPYCTVADENSDGAVDLRDIAEFELGFGAWP